MGTQRAVATGGNSFVIMKNISSEKKGSGMEVPQVHDID